MSIPIKKISGLLVLLLFTTLLHAQYTKANDDPDADFKTAKELYQKEQFSLAYPVFKYLYSNGVGNSNYPATIKIEAKYYYITCGLKLNDSSVELLAQDFINLEHHTPRIEMMAYELGEYHFRKKNFANAIEYYDKAGIDNLTNEEIASLQFHKAYSYFTLQDFEKALPLFNSVRQLRKDPNYFDANYYYGFISFYKQNYTEALNAFTIVQNHPSYINIVPFYLAEIYYFQGDLDKALQTAERAIKNGGQYYDLQLKQLAGHLLFDKKEYERALVYLQDYYKHSDKVSREDLYELSYCYYAQKLWKQSIDGFKQLGGKEDSLAQNSMYLLATAYLRVNDKVNARNAFLFCEMNNSNPVQKEISQFNYAKLSYELDLNDIASKELQSFIGNYPNSEYLQEAKELQISVMANTSNYKDALILFENLSVQSEAVKKIYPKILYGRAVELINDQNISQADELLNKIIQAPYNNSFLQLVYFWKGEIAYRTDDANTAVTYFEKYLLNPQTNGEVNSTNAKYSLAYSLFKKEDYNRALQYFQQVTATINAASSPIQSDAYVRSADCYFMNKKYNQALSMYNNIIAINAPQSDYALYQKAVIAGAANRNTEKIALLASLQKQYPSSSLNSEANLEIANTYMADEKFNEAILPLEKIISDSGTTNSLLPKAYLKLGVSQFNANNNKAALNSFTQLVYKYPNSQETNEAIEYIRSIFIANQQPEQFTAFMKQNGKPLSYSEEDSLTYRSATLRYEEKDYANALQGFMNYLSKFPDGKNAIEANYISAEINVSNKNDSAALPFYKAVAAKAPNKYAERSALQCARIYFFDLKDYAVAENYYTQLKQIATQQENKLEAMRGLLRCQYKQQQWKEAVANAQDLLQEKSIATDDKMMANLCIAKSLQNDGKLSEAMIEYKRVTELGKAEFSAEAQYRVAEILYQQHKSTEAEKAGFEVIKKYGSYDYWVTKAYILLGDVYVQENDLFNAEATFKSVVENATITDLQLEAQHKLADVAELKAKSTKVEQQ